MGDKDLKINKIKFLYHGTNLYVFIDNRDS